MRRQHRTQMQALIAIEGDLLAITENAEVLDYKARRERAQGGRPSDMIYGSGRAALDGKTYVGAQRHLESETRRVKWEVMRVWGLVDEI
jgi:hypothetical protein